MGFFRKIPGSEIPKKNFEFNIIELLTIDKRQCHR